MRMAWPPRSGRVIEFPEVDRGQWFPLAAARAAVLPAQAPLLDRLEARLETLPAGSGTHPAQGLNETNRIPR